MDKVYKIIEVVGCSSENYNEAIKNAVDEAAKTLKGMAWFEVMEMRGGIKDGKVSEYQATCKIGFRLID